MNQSVIEVKTIFIDNLPIFYLFNSYDEHKPTVFCFHGNSSIAETFYRFIELTNGHVNVIAPDLPGCGRSGRLTKSADSDSDSKSKSNSNPYSMQSVGQIMTRFVNSFSTDPRTTYFFGHSLGGHLLAYIDFNPTGVILAGTPPLSGPNDFARAFKPDEEAAKLLPYLSSEETFSPEIARKFVAHTGVTGDLLELMCENAEQTDGLFRSGCLRTLADVDQISQLAETPKVLIIHAENDGIINQNYIETCLPRCSVCVVPGKHMSPILQTEKIINECRKKFSWW